MPMNDGNSGRPQPSVMQNTIDTGRMVVGVALTPIFAADAYSIDDYEEDSRKCVAQLRAFADHYDRETKAAIASLREQLEARKLIAEGKGP